MNEIPKTTEVLSAMITPAVLISAAGTLILSTSNRLGRVSDRIRGLANIAEGLHNTVASSPAAKARLEEKRKLIAEQLGWLSKRLLILRTAMTILYTSIGILVTTSIAVGVVALLRWQYGWVPVVLGMIGASALLYSSLLLVREARQAVSSTLQELTFVRLSVHDEDDRETN